MASIQSLPAELLEHVLQYLSMGDLLLDQRVCKQWRQIIKPSPQLQRIMFLGFVPTGKLSAVELSHFVHDNKSCSSPSSERRKSQATLNEKDRQSEDNGVVDINTLDKSSSGLIVQFNPVFPSEGEVIRMRTTQFRAKLDSQNSWLDMYLTQPPCSQAETTVYYKRSSGIACRIFGRTGSDTMTCVVKVVRAEGVRAKDVLDAARKACVGEIKKWQRIDIQVPGVVYG